MKVQITASMVQTMSGLIECGLDASKVIGAKMQQAKDEVVMGFAPGVERIQNDMVAGR